MLRDRKREEKKSKSVVPRNEDADVIPLLHDLRFMNHIVSGAAARDDEPYERTGRRGARRPVSSTADLLGIPLRSVSIIGRQLADAPPRIAKTRNYSLINCQRSMWPYA